jgi:hypothetical protein
MNKKIKPSLIMLVIKQSNYLLYKVIKKINSKQQRNKKLKSAAKSALKSLSDERYLANYALTVGQLQTELGNRKMRAWIGKWNSEARPKMRILVLLMF